MDPLIRNIEANININRAEILNTPVPKALAYADDITCLIENDVNNVKEIFAQYERLTRASGLSLNADKTEILDINENQYKVVYEGNEHCIRGTKAVKINGIAFNKDIPQMKEENYNGLVTKIEKMLVGWKARQLSLLGKILIYKTFGMSQVLYTLSIISLNAHQYKKIDMMFQNFLWGRDLNNMSRGARIERSRLNTRIEYGGFGMVQYERILEGVYRRQLSKMYDKDFNHPVRSMIVKNDICFATGKSLTELADDIAKRAHMLMDNLTWKYVKNLNNEQITEDITLFNQLGARDIGVAIKIRWLNSVEVMRLVHVLGCNSIKDIIDQGREAVRLSKIVLKAPYVRIIKALWQAHTRCENVQEDKFRLLNGCYKQVHKIKSKEFRELLDGPPKLTTPKIDLNFDINEDEGRWTVKSYFSKIKKLANTKHKNTLLRIWNGDCLSHTRLVHLQIVDSNLCPNCASVDTPMHVLVECEVATRTWTQLMAKLPKSPHIQMIEYALGVYDGKIEISIKAEILKMLMHFRDMSAEAIHIRLKNYFLITNPNNPRIKQIFGG
jgi:zinc-binding in reverse transcriptase